MEAVKIILLILAYTIGIITITLQLVCYKKEIEYKETLFLSISFLLLIVASTVSEFSILADSSYQPINDFSLYFFLLLLAFSLPINIHKERIVNNQKLRNSIILLLTLLLFLFLIGGFVFGYFRIAKISIIVFLNISIFYSMYLNIREKPSLLVRHREKAERKIAQFFLFFFPFYTAIGLLNMHYAFISYSLLDGSIILSLIFIVLAVSKLTDDIQRLTLFSSKNQYSSDKLSLYNISPRELEVLNLLTKGFSYTTIAEKLFISLPTVKTHVSNIYQKMNVKNKVELINLLNS